MKLIHCPHCKKTMVSKGAPNPGWLVLVMALLLLGSLALHFQPAEEQRDLPEESTHSARQVVEQPGPELVSAPTPTPVSPKVVEQAPSLFMLDDQDAVIFVGESVPYACTSCCCSPGHHKPDCFPDYHSCDKATKH